MSDPFAVYTELVKRLDAFFWRVSQAHPLEMKCQLGCTDCCQNDLGLFPVEGMLLITALEGLPAEDLDAIVSRARKQAADDATCPLLAGKACSVYQARPIICRTHGIPTVFCVGDEKPELSLCPYNFKNINKLASDSVLNLDPVNAALATINHLVCQQQGISPERKNISTIILARFGRDDEP